MAYDFNSMPVGPYAEPAVKPDLATLIRAWEKLRELNTGGYGGGIVAKIKGWQGTSARRTTDCSSFTSTAIAMAFSQGDSEPYTPVYDGSKPLPAHFYRFHCGYSPGDDSMTGTLKALGIKLKDWKWDETLGDSAGSIIWFNLGKRVDDPWQDLQRGDLLKIEWSNGHGHATFCWDVHRDKDGKVDAFQFVSSNGLYKAGKPVGAGISVVRVPADPRFLDTGGGKYTKKDRNVFADVLEGKEYDEYAEYPWYAMPGVPYNGVDKGTFRAPARKIAVIYKGDGIYAARIKVARLHGVGQAPPAKAPPAKAPEPPAKAPDFHFEGESQPVKDGAAESIKPAVVEQPKDKGTDFQLEVEEGLATLFRARWIDADPGEPDAVNDAASQAAIKDFQGKFGGLKQTGLADRATRDCLRRVLQDVAHQEEIELGLVQLHQAGKLDADPGVPDGVNDAQSKKAILEFQRKNGLSADGIPGPKTRKKLREVLDGLGSAPPALKPSEQPPAVVSPDEEELRRKIVEIARHEALDLKVRTDVSPCVDSGGRIDEYFRIATGKVPDHKSVGERQYCAAFSAFCYKSAGAELKANPWVPTLLKNLKAEGRLVTTPKPGDLFFFRTRGSAPDAQGQPHHVGIVARVDAKKIHTFEGNTYGAGTGKTSDWGVWAREYPIEGTKTNIFEAFASPVKPGAAKAKPPEPKPAEAARAGAPTLLWGTNLAAPGATVELKLHAPGIDEKTPKVLVVLYDHMWWPHLAADAGAVQEAHPGLLRRFIQAPLALAGSTYRAGILIADGTQVITPDALTIAAGKGQPIDDPVQHQTAPAQAGPCEDCKKLQALVEAGTVATKIQWGSKDKASNILFQRHLVAFGYDLGNTVNGAGKTVDPADGDYGGMTIKAARLFYREAGFAGADPKKLTPAQANLVIERCKAGFKSACGPSPDAPGASGKVVKSGRITVAGKPFVEWFNQDFKPKKNRSSGYDIHDAKPKMMWPDLIYSERNFRAVFDHLDLLSGKEETPLAEFLAYFCIFYNEVGGTFRPTTEGGGPKYAFGTQGGKASYNMESSMGTPDHLKTRKAGDQLKAMGLISSPADVQAWNGTVYPDSAPENVKTAANQCDFFKFRGHGFSQITWREGHKKYVDPALKEAGSSKLCEDLTTEELDEVMEQDHRVYLRAVYHEWHHGQVGAALPKVNQSPPVFADVGWHISGSQIYGKVFEMRCKDLMEAMEAAGWECS